MDLPKFVGRREPHPLTWLIKRNQPNDAPDPHQASVRSVPPPRFSTPRSDRGLQRRTRGKALPQKKKMSARSGWRRARGNSWRTSPDVRHSHPPLHPSIDSPTLLGRAARPTAAALFRLVDREYFPNGRPPPPRGVEGYQGPSPFMAILAYSEWALTSPANGAITLAAGTPSINQARQHRSVEGRPMERRESPAGLTDDDSSASFSWC